MMAVRLFEGLGPLLCVGDGGSQMEFKRDALDNGEEMLGFNDGDSSVVCRLDEGSDV